MEQQILSNAELFVELIRDQLSVAIEFDEAGVRWLDGYITRQRDDMSVDTKRGLPNTVGSFLGECVRRTYGGRWVRDDQAGQWGVKVNDRLTVFPFAKVHKQLAGHEGESVLATFSAIALLMHGIPPEAIDGTP